MKFYRSLSVVLPLILLLQLHVHGQKEKTQYSEEIEDKIAQVEKNLSGAWLIALQDSVGEGVDSLVLAYFVTALQHGRSFASSGGY